MFVNYWISQLSIFCASYISLCSKNLAPWITYIYDVTVSLGQASVPSIAGSSVSGCQKAAAELWGRTVLSSEAWLGRICFQAHIVVGGINLLLGCQTEALGCLLAISWRPPTYSWYTGITCMTTCFLTAIKDIIFYLDDLQLMSRNHVQIITYIYHLCLILLIRDKSQFLFILRSRVHAGCEHQVAGTMETTAESVCHNILHLDFFF